MPGQPYSQKVLSLRERTLEPWSRGYFEPSGWILGVKPLESFDFQASEGPRCSYSQHVLGHCWSKISIKLQYLPPGSYVTATYLSNKYFHYLQTSKSETLDIFRIFGTWGLLWLEYLEKIQL